MATTTNYSWTTPDDTALVKDGASAIRSLGSSIDTTTKNLNPQTTTGAIAYRSATSNVNTSLPIGTAGQVLTVNSGATAPEWATPTSGGMTLLSTTSLSGAVTTVSGISGAYQDLLLIIQGMTNLTGNGQPELRINASTTIHFTTGTRTISATTSTVSNQDQLFLAGDSSPNSLRTSADNVWVVKIWDYAQTSYHKGILVNGFFINSSSANTSVSFGGGLKTNSAISSFNLRNTGGDLNGGQVKVYGIK